MSLIFKEATNINKLWQREFVQVLMRHLNSSSAELKNLISRKNEIGQFKIYFLYMFIRLTFKKSKPYVQNNFRFCIKVYTNTIKTRWIYKPGDILDDFYLILFFYFSVFANFCQAYMTSLTGEKYNKCSRVKKKRKMNTHLPATNRPFLMMSCLRRPYSLVDEEYCAAYEDSHCSGQGRLLSVMQLLQ